MHRTGRLTRCDSGGKPRAQPVHVRLPDPLCSWHSILAPNCSARECSVHTPCHSPGRQRCHAAKCSTGQEQIDGCCSGRKHWLVAKYHFPVLSETVALATNPQTLSIPSVPKPRHCWRLIFEFAHGCSHGAAGAIELSPGSGKISQIGIITWAVGLYVECSDIAKQHQKRATLLAHTNHRSA